MQPTYPKSLHELMIFRDVAYNQSFVRTSEKYNISASAVSHLIQQLEQQLAIRLFNRSTRKVRLTPAGEAFLRNIEPALQQLERSFLEVQSCQQQISGLIRLTMPNAAESLMTPLIAAFLRTHPSISFDIDVSDGLKDVIADGFDAGIRYEEKLQNGWIAFAIRPTHRFCVIATPSFIEQYGQPYHPKDLADFDCINFKFPSGKHYKWEFMENHSKFDIEVFGRVATNDMRQVVAFAKDSLGIGYTYWDNVKEDIANGTLVSLLDSYLSEAEKFYLYYPSRKFNSPAFNLFVQWVKTYDFPSSFLTQS